MTKLTHAKTIQSVNSTVLDPSVVQIESSIMLGRTETHALLSGGRKVCARLKKKKKK